MNSPAINPGKCSQEAMLTVHDHVLRNAGPLAVTTGSLFKDILILILLIPSRTKSKYLVFPRFTGFFWNKHHHG